MTVNKYKSNMCRVTMVRHMMWHNHNLLRIVEGADGWTARYNNRWSLHAQVVLHLWLGMMNFSLVGPANMLPPFSSRSAKVKNSLLGPPSSTAPSELPPSSMIFRDYGRSGSKLGRLIALLAPSNTLPLITFTWVGSLVVSTLSMSSLTKSGRLPIRS